MAGVTMNSLVACAIASCVAVGGIGGCAGTQVGTEREEMKAEQQGEYPVHLLVSNQSLAVDPSAVEVSIDDRRIFQRELSTGTQHTWERETISARSGKHILTVSESKTQTRHSQEVNVDRELWVVIAFHGPPAQLKVNVFDHPVGLM
jgi:hypothetical protein